MRRPAAPLAAILAALPSLAWAEDFVCRGHDPGWELVGRDSRATLAPEKGARRSLIGGSSQLTAEGIVVWRGRAGPGEPDLVAVMLKGACTDPMAGEVSGYLAILSGPQGTAAVGCCTYGKAALAAAATAPAATPAAPPAAPPRPAAPASVQAIGTAEAEAPEPPAVTRKPPSGLRTGASARIAGSARRNVNLRGAPNASARVVAKLPGGRTVVVQQVSEHGGQTWYRVRGRGVPANAWVRGDLLLGR